MIKPDDIGMIILLVVGLSAISLSLYMMRLEAKFQRAQNNLFRPGSNGTAASMGTTVPAIDEKENS